jgi:hypothetical protein
MRLTKTKDLPFLAAQREAWLAQGSNIAELFSIEGKLDEDLFRVALVHTFREVERMRS